MIIVAHVPLEGGSSPRSKKSHYSLVTKQYLNSVRLLSKKKRFDLRELYVTIRRVRFVANVRQFLRSVTNFRSRAVSLGFNSMLQSHQEKAAIQ